MINLFNSIIFKKESDARSTATKFVSLNKFKIEN